MRNSSLSSSPARSSTMATAGANGPSSVPVDEFHFPADLISVQDRNDEALVVLKADLMSALAKKVKSLDEDNCMFEGPRSCINLKTGDFLKKNAESLKHNLLLPKQNLITLGCHTEYKLLKTKNQDEAHSKFCGLT